MTEQSQTSYACLFPGQGSQEMGMGLGVYNNSPRARQIIDFAEDRLQKEGYSLKSLMFEDPEHELSGSGTNTARVQPAVLTASVATNEALSKLGVRSPVLNFGHSLGKISALVASGSLDFSEALDFVIERGKQMSEAKRDQETIVGLVLGLNKQIIEQKLSELGDRVNSFKVTVVNAPTLLLIGGEKAQWGVVAESLKIARAKLIKIYEEAPLSHHPLLSRVQQILNNFKLSLQTPEVPILDDISDQLLQAVDQVRESLDYHLVNPVEWTNKPSYLQQIGVKYVVEVGSGQVFQGIMKRGNPEFNFLSTRTWEDILHVRDILNPDQKAA